MVRMSRHDRLCVIRQQPSMPLLSHIKIMTAPLADVRLPLLMKRVGKGLSSVECALTMLRSSLHSISVRRCHASAQMRSTSGSSDKRVKQLMPTFAGAQDQQNGRQPGKVLNAERTRGSCMFVAGKH